MEGGTVSKRGPDLQVRPDAECDVKYEGFTRQHKEATWVEATASTEDTHEKRGQLRQTLTFITTKQESINLK